MSSTVLPGGKSGASSSSEIDDHYSMEKLWTKTEARLWSINLFIGTLTVYAARIALPICAIAVAKEYNFNKSDSGTVLSCFFWGYASTQILGGYLADNYGGERVLVVSTLFWAVTTCFTPQLFDLAAWMGQPLVFLVLVRIAKGVSQGFHYPCMASIVSRHLTSADKGRVFGICMAGSHAGTVLAGSIGSILLELFGWRVVFYFIGSLGVLWWLYLQQLIATGGRRISDGAPAVTLPLLHSMSESNLLGAVTGQPKKMLPISRSVPWKTLFSKPAFWAAFTAQYCGANAYFTLFSWLPSYFADNFPHAKGVVFNVVPNLAIVTTAILSPFIAAKLISKGYSITNTRKIMEGASLFGLAMCLLIVSWVTTFESALFLFTLGMACRGLHHGGVSVNPQDFAPNHTGAVFGVFNTAGAIPGFVGVYVAGTILQWTKSWAYVFTFTAFQCLLGVMVYSMFGTAKQII